MATPMAIDNDRKGYDVNPSRLLRPPQPPPPPPSYREVGDVVLRTLQFRRCLMNRDSAGALKVADDADANGVVLDCSLDFDGQPPRRPAVELLIDLIAVGANDDREFDLADVLVRSNAFPRDSDFDSALNYAASVRCRWSINVLTSTTCWCPQFFSPDRGVALLHDSAIFYLCASDAYNANQFIDNATSAYLNQTLAVPKPDAGSRTFGVTNVFKSVIAAAASLSEQRNLSGTAASAVIEARVDLAWKLLCRHPEVDFDVVHPRCAFAERLTVSAAAASHVLRHFFDAGERITAYYYELLVGLYLPAALKHALPIPDLIAAVCAYASRMPLADGIITFTEA